MKGGKLPASVKGGLSETYSFAGYNPSDCGMAHASGSKNSKPKGPDKGAVSEKDPLSPGRPGGLRWK